MSLDTEQIKEKLDIVDVISAYIKVEKAGINFKAKCPFHNEKTPSFFISPTRQSFYCFGCGEKGDIFSFVEKFEGLDFKGALEILANKAGVELKNFRPNNAAEQKEKIGEKDKLFKIMEKATKIFEKRLAENKKALDILKKRGVLPASITKWRLGFAEDEWRNLYDELIQDGFSKKDLLEAGLIKKVSNEEKYYDTFRNRIIFPISDNAGRIIAFSGRTLKKDDKTPKYLNSPETKLFYKSEVLYGFNIAKNHIRQLDYAVLVEGQMDLIMSHQAGILNTVASSGTALTKLHLKKIKRLSNRVVIAYDSDSAGEKATGRAAEIAMSLGMEVKTISLPKGEDPASVIKKSPENFKKALKKTEGFMDFILNKALKEKEDRNKIKEITKNVLPLVPLIKSDIEKSQFIKKIALKIKVREEDVRNDLKKIKEIKITKEIKLPEKYPKIINLERILAGIILLGESGKNKKFENLKKKWQKIANKDKVEESLKNFEKDKEALIFETEKYGEEGDLVEIAEDILRRIELKNLKIELQRITIQLDDKNLSKRELKETELNFNKIQKHIKEIKN